MARKKNPKNLEEKRSEPETQDSQDERAIKYVLECKKESLDFYDLKFKQFNYFDRLYQKGAAKTNVPYGRANLELPLAFQQVEPFVDTMMETMIGEAPYIAYSGRNADDDKAAEEITDFTQYQLECGAFVPSMNLYYRNLGKYGTGVVKAVWETDMLEIKTEEEVPLTGIDPSTGVPIQVGTSIKTETKDYKKHDGPVFYNVSLFDFGVPKSATSCDVQKMEWVWHRVYRTYEQLLENPNYNRNKDKLKKMLDDQKRDSADGTYSRKNLTALRDEAKRISQEQKNPSTGGKKYEGKIEVIEWWGNYCFNKDSIEMKPALVAIAFCDNDSICLRLDDNPFKFKFKPFLMSNDYLVEGEPYGYGELHHIKGLIEESTALRNARLDVANISLNRVWLVERQAGVNLRDLYTAPNKIILTNDLNGIRPLDMGQITSSSVQELSRIDFDIQNTTEIVNPRQDVASVGPGFGTTATGVSYLAGKSNRRMLSKARIQEETFFKPLALMMNWYNRDMITDDIYYRVAGQEDKNPYRWLPADAFLTDVDFKPTSNPQKLSIAERKDSMAYLLQVVAQVEGIAPGTNNLPKLMRDVYKLSGFPHPDEYVLDKPTMVLQLPNGQMVDSKGQPIQVQPVDEQGKPLTPEGTPNG